MMISTETLDDARYKRLQWRCRRGTRELDRLFGGWLEREYRRADASTLEAFDTLMEAQDPDLWDWVMGHAVAPQADWRRIIDVIRAHHRL